MNSPLLLNKKDQAKEQFDLKRTSGNHPVLLTGPLVYTPEHRGVNVGGCGGVVHPPREMIQSVSNYVQSVSKLCVCLHAVLCEAN